MLQTITAKLQILVNPSDKQIICDTMKAYSDACNYVSEYIYKAHNLSRYSVQYAHKILPSENGVHRLHALDNK